jgi:shikimate kinase
VSEPAPIVLIGLMGAGKSVVGRSLADRLGGGFVDTDDQLAREAGRSISELFAEEGEVAFRQRELRALAAALSRPDVAVVATGGGVVTTEAGRSLLLGAPSVVFLDVSVEAALARVGDARSRPLLAGDPEGRLRSLAAERRPAYLEVADVSVDASGRSVQAVVDDVLEALGVRS